MAKIQGYSEDDVDLLIADFEHVVEGSIQRTLQTTANNLHGAIVADASSAGLNVSDIHIITQTWQDEVDGTLNPYIAEVYTGSATSVAIGLGTSFPDDSLPGIPLIADDFTNTYMKTVTNRLVGVSDELWEEVRNELLDGIAQGQGIPQIRDRIMALHGYSQQRATVIARTEIHGAAEAGSISQMRYVGFNDDDTTKEWVAVIGDGRTRHTHVVANGQKVRLSEKFTVGSSLLDHPGVAGAPADEVIQCRCTMVFDTEAEPKIRCNSPLIAASTSNTCVVPVKPADISLLTTSQIKRLFDAFMSHKITPAYGGSKIHKILADVRAELKVGSEADQALEAVVSDRQILSAVDKLYVAKKDTFTTKYVQWSDSAAGKKVLGAQPSAPVIKAVKVPIVEAPDPIPPTLLQPPSQSKFTILDDPGPSGDGYAPGGQWGKYGSSGVLIRAKDAAGTPRFLLIQRGEKYQGSQKFKWQLPGGGADKYEGPYEAAARELWEETQASKEYVESMTPLGEMVYDGGMGWKYTSIVAHADSTFVPKVHGSTGDAKWFTLDEIKEMLANGDIVKELSPTLGQLSDELDQLAVTKMVDAPKLPTIAPKPKALEIQYTGKTLGSHGAQVWENPVTGDKWLFKPQEKFATDLDLATAKIQSKALQTRPGVYEMELNGQKGSIQYMFESTDAFPHGSFNPLDLSTEDIVTMQETQVFDWMVSNFDTHSGQWIRLSNGELFETDKGQAFKFFGKDKLSWDYVPVTPLGNDKLTYVPMWRAFVEGKDVALQDPTTGPLGEYIDRLMAIDDTTYRELLRPYASHWRQGKDLEDFLDAAVARKNNLKKDFGEFYAKAVAERAKHLPAPKTSPIPKVEPSPEPIIPKVTPSPTTGVSTDISQIDLNTKLYITDKFKAAGGGKKVTPGWGGAKIYKVLQEMKEKEETGVFDDISDLQMLRVLDEQGGFTGKPKTYESQVVEWLQTPAGKKWIAAGNGHHGTAKLEPSLIPKSPDVVPSTPKVEPVLPIQAVVSDEATDVLATGKLTDSSQIATDMKLYKKKDVIAYGTNKEGNFTYRITKITDDNTAVRVEHRYNADPGSGWVDEGDFTLGNPGGYDDLSMWDEGGITWKLKPLKTSGESKIPGKLPNDDLTSDEIWASRNLWENGDVVGTSIDHGTEYQIISNGKGNLTVEYRAYIQGENTPWIPSTQPLKNANSINLYSIDFKAGPDILNGTKESHVIDHFVGDQISTEEIIVHGAAADVPPGNVIAYGYEKEVQLRLVKNKYTGMIELETKPPGVKYWDISHGTPVSTETKWYVAKKNGDPPDTYLSLLPGEKTAGQQASKTVGKSKTYIDGATEGDEVTSKQIWAAQYNSPPPGTVLAESANAKFRVVYHLDDNLHLESYSDGKWVDFDVIANYDEMPSVKWIAASKQVEVPKPSPIGIGAPKLPKLEIKPKPPEGALLTLEKMLAVDENGFKNGDIVAYGTKHTWKGKDEKWRIVRVDDMLFRQKQTSAGAWTSTEVIKDKYSFPYGIDWKATHDTMTQPHIKAVKKYIAKTGITPNAKTPKPSVKTSPKSSYTPTPTTPPKPKVPFTPAEVDISEYTPSQQSKIIEVYKKKAMYATGAKTKWIAMQETKAKLHVKYPEGNFELLSDAQLLKIIDEQLAKELKIPNVHGTEAEITEWLQTREARVMISKRIDAPIAAGDVPTAVTDFSASPIDPTKQDYKTVTVSEAIKYQEEANAKYGAWTTAQKAALKQYTGGSYSTWNAAIRSGDLGSYRAKIVAAQQGARPSTRAMLLSRGTTFAELNDPGITSYETLLTHVGQTYISRGFTSTGVAGGGYGGQLKIEIEAPIGTPMSHVSDFSHYPSERETTLPAHLIYQILSVKKASDNSSQTIMRVRVVGAR